MLSPRSEMLTPLKLYIYLYIYIYAYGGTEEVCTRRTLLITRVFLCDSSRMVEYSLDLQNVNFTAIRTVRVLRPLKAINRVPSKCLKS